MQGTKSLSESIAYGDRTLFEIVTDVMSGTNRSALRTPPPETMKPCSRCGYYGCACGTPEFETWLAEQG